MKVKLAYVRMLDISCQILGVRTKRGSCSMHGVFHTGSLAQLLYGSNLLRIRGRAVSNL